MLILPSQIADILEDIRKKYVLDEHSFLEIFPIFEVK